MPLADVLAAIEEQTGNQVLDYREEFNQPAANDPVTIEFQNEPFWSAVDQILDQANLGVYNFAGLEALALVNREAGERRRHGKAQYSGPFRFDALEVQSQRGLRRPNQKSLRLQIEIAWEPRLRPIALSQPLADITARGDDGQALELSSERPVLDVEVPAGNQATELVLPFTLPSRDVKRIESLRSKLTALVPGRRATFRFGDLQNSAGQSQRHGGVVVSIDTVRQNGVIWEVHMRLRIDDSQSALESHRTWALQNVSFIETPEGETIDHVGFETTRQTENEVGLAYLFDLPDGPTGLTWVYETPASIIQLPVEYELTSIPLP
jgi:hypothetical protein